MRMIWLEAPKRNEHRNRDHCRNRAACVLVQYERSVRIQSIRNYANGHWPNNRGVVYYVADNLWEDRS